MRTIFIFLISILTTGNLAAQDSLQKASFSRNLSGVTVTAAKPLIEKKQDRTIVNVDRMITASAGTAMDVLSKLPGVSVDPEGMIRYNNKSGVLVLIDNRPTYLSGADLQNLFRNMAANEIESVEIIPNPPARYDAAGNAGILNIRTKKGLKRGSNGSLVLSASQGQRTRESAVLNLNHRNEKWNAFGSLTTLDRRNKNDQHTDRIFPGNGSTKDQHVNGHDNISQHSRSEALKFGADHYLAPKTTLGVLINAGLRDADFRSATETLLLSGDSLTNKLHTNTSGDLNRKQATGNLNFRQQFGKPGQELTADLDYLHYRSTTNQQIMTRFYNPGNEENGMPLELQSAALVAINVWSAKIDYAHPLSEKMRIEAGIKINHVSSSNRLNYLRMQDSKWIEDARTNDFKYTERINAAYVNYAATFGNFSLQAGLRAEQTNGKGVQQKGGIQFTRDTLNFFPTVFLTYKLSDLHSMGVSYGRRIERPQYELLNPFIVMLDTLTAEQGNPALRPQYANNFGLNYTYNRSLQFSLDYSATNDVLSKLVHQAPGEKITIFMFQNISRLRTATASVTYSAAITRWWQGSYYSALIRTSYKGMAEGAEVSLRNTSFNANISNSFQWQRGWTAEISATYNGRYLNEFLSIAQPILELNLGIAKSIWDNKARIQLSVNDISRPRYRMRTEYGNVNMNYSSLSDSRRVGLTFTWKFGKTTVEKASERTTGTRDVESRLKN